MSTPASTGAKRTRPGRARPEDKSDNDGATNAKKESEDNRSDAAGDQESPRAPGLVAGYGVLLSGYALLVGTITWAARRRGVKVRDLGPFELVTYGLATQHLSRVVSKDSITTVLRAPFTKFEDSAGEGEVNEKVVGTGLRHAVGELLTCPFCLGQWVATALMAGRVLAPDLTTAAVSVSAAARAADYLQLMYGALQNAQ